MTRSIIYRYKKGKRNHWYVSRRYKKGGEWIPVGIAIKCEETQSGIATMTKPEGLEEAEG